MRLPYSVIKKCLFALPAETAHTLSFQLMKAFGASNLLFPTADVPMVPVTKMGLTFRNPLGLSAGLDKDGMCLSLWSKLGFGFIEIGTVTPKPQTGNPKPRLFRLQQDKALINRLGFNNLGVDQLVPKLQAYQGQAILGVNIGKNKSTPNEQAEQDYLTCFHKVAPYADYITVNISSPNTPNLRALQEGDSLKKLLLVLKQAQQQYQTPKKPLPICVKIAPDLSSEALQALAAILCEFNIEGVIATNTTIRRDFNLQGQHQDEIGGLSGAPLFSLSTQTAHALKQIVGEKMCVVGSGGIMDTPSALSKLNAGADLIQVYTGLIYYGPTLITDIVRALHQERQQDVIKETQAL